MANWHDCEHEWAFIRLEVDVEIETCVLCGAYRISDYNNETVVIEEPAADGSEEGGVNERD